MKKRGGMELTTSTIVIVVIAVLLLVLGIVMVKKTMCAVYKGIGAMDDLVKKEIESLYTEQNNNIVVKEITNEIPKGSYYGVGFGIRNEEKRDNTKFTYTVKVIDLGDCDISEKEAESYIVLGKDGSISIPTGDSYADLIKFKLPKNAPICNLKYEITVKNDNQLYGSARFEVIIKPSSMIDSIIC